MFDKELRRAARKYNREFIVNIESVCNEIFLNHIKKLGPTSNLDIPMKIKEGDNFITNESTVLKRWRDDFDNLLNQKNSNIEFDDIFLQTASNTRNTIEVDMKSEGYLGNILLNRDVAIDEIEKVVAKLKK